MTTPTSQETHSVSREQVDRLIHEIETQSATDILDCRATLARLDQDVELFYDLLGFYFKDTPELTAAIDRAISASDADALRRHAHRLKGLISNFDAHQAVQTAAELEELGRNDRLGGARPLFERLEKELVRLSDWLKRF